MTTNTPTPELAGDEDARLYCFCGEPEHEPTAECPGGDGDLTDCPYFRRYAGVPGADPDGICSHGCYSEPACVTDRPLGGWPYEAALLGGDAAVPR